MEPARLESLCFLYVGAVFTLVGSLLFFSTGTFRYVIIFGTGPIFLAQGIYWLRNPDARANPATEYGLGTYALLTLAVFATITTSVILYLQFT